MKGDRSPPSPARAISSDVDVRERPVGARCAIHANAAHQILVLPLHLLHRVQNHSRVPIIDASIVVQIIHAAVAIVVDEDIGRVPVHVATDLRASPSLAAARALYSGVRNPLMTCMCVTWMPRDSSCAMTSSNLSTSADRSTRYLGHTDCLVVRQEVAQPEMLRDPWCRHSPA